MIAFEPGCHTQAETLDELMSNVQEAIQLYIEILDEDEKEELLKQKVSGIQRVSIPEWNHPSKPAETC